MSFPYVPIDAKGWRLHMGLRPLDESHWLEVDEGYESELSLKRELLARDGTSVLATRPEGDDASAELLAMVRENLRRYHQEIPVSLDEKVHPIVAASLLVQEDWCVLVRDEHWRLQAACVCFPSRWDLKAKIGTTIDEIHAPVPGYDHELARPTSAFLDRLSSERAYWRLNWTLLDDDTLFQPRRTATSQRTGLDDWFVRVERQTFRHLARTNAIAFSIRTYVASLARLRVEHHELTTHLLGALDTAPPDVQEYKGWVGVADQLRELLR